MLKRGNECDTISSTAITDNNKFLAPCSAIYNNNYTYMYRYPSTYPCGENENLYSKKNNA